MSAPDPTFVRPPSQWRELWLSRLRGFVREPGVLFWVFGFPLVLSVVLGLAFREKGPERFAVVLVEGGAGSADLGKALRASPLLAVTEAAPAAAEASLARAEALVLVRPGATRPELSYDPTRPGTEAAAALVRMALLPAPPDGTPPTVDTVPVTTRGRRYIDFLIPGLLGMGLMGGGIWGVGYEIVSMRVKRLLKRFVATPMSRPAFLGSFAIHRLTVAAVEATFLLVFARLAFDVRLQGSLLDVVLLSLLGALSFSGLGLLVACRARNMETANGLMNVATLPMWLLSGVFFAATNFPAWMRPLVKALPLTALNDALRAVINDGASIAACGAEVGVLAAWGLVSFGLALRFFRWQ